MRMIAPFPGTDSAEGPYKLNAVTVAQMLRPHSILYGVVFSVLIGTRHDIEFMIAVTDPSQL